MFVLDYGGPFQCKTVQYMTDGTVAAVLLIVTVVVACCKLRRKLKRSAEPIRSAYPGYILSFYRQMPYPAVSVMSNSANNTWLSVHKLSK